MRLSPSTEKQDCRVIDFVDSTSRVAGVISAPTLFGLLPGEIDIDGNGCSPTLMPKLNPFSDDTLESLERRTREHIASSDVYNVPRPTTVTYTEYEDPFSLIGDSSGVPHIATLSNNAWVACGGDVYVLDLLGQGHIRVEPIESIEGATFCAHFTQAMMTPSLFKSTPFLRNRQILSAATLSDAIRGCDTYAANKFARGHLAIGTKTFTLSQMEEDARN
ncbi:hypothetical protein C0992_001953 [Termitomyces sp. T32_za158]|nr:hypothetical protein C0992_001953 [Termitomyces sp. T32_za158]